MTPTAFERLLSALRITYAITDARFRVVEVGGADSPYLCPDHLGMAIGDVLPELTGYEPLLDSIADGRAPQLDLPWINREIGGAQTVYLRVGLQAYPSATAAAPSVSGKLVILAAASLSKWKFISSMGPGSCSATTTRSLLRG